MVSKVFTFVLLPKNHYFLLFKMLNEYRMKDLPNLNTVGSTKSNANQCLKLTKNSKEILN